MASGDKRTVSVNIVGDSASYKKAMSEAEQQTGKSGGIITGIFAGVGIGATNLAIEGVGKVVGFLGDSAKVAQEAEVTTTRLTTALRDNVKGFTGTADAMEGSIDAGRRLGFTGDELRASLAALVTVTKSTGQAQADQAAAEDLARARGIDLATATNIIVKAQEGNVGALRKLGIIVPAVTSNVDALKASHQKYTPEQLKAAQALDKAATATAALATIQKSAKGQADAYAGTMAGSMARAGTIVEGIQEKLGETLNNLAAAVLPPLIDALSSVADWFGGVVQSVQPLLPVVEALAQQYLSALGSAFTSIVAAVQPLIPVLEDLAGKYLTALVKWSGFLADVIVNRVIPVVVSVVKAVLPPLTAALKWLADDVVPAVSAAFTHVAGKVFPLVSSAIDWIVKNVLPPLGAAFGWIVKNVLPPVVAAFQWVADNVLPALGKGFDFMTDKVIPAFSNLIQGVGKTVASVFGMVVSIFRGAANAEIGVINILISAWNALKFTMPRIDMGPLGSIGGFTIGTPNIGLIPKLHTGGIVPGTTGTDVLAILQAGERVLPRGAAGGQTIIVNINGGLIDGPTIDALTNALTRRLRFAPGT